LISHGIFGRAESTAHAWLSNAVPKASHCTCTLTGQGSTVATVRTVGIEGDVCPSDAEYPVTPEPGNIMSGTAFVVATVDAGGLARQRSRGWSLFHRDK
jgi:hypothetical protein